MKRIFAIIGERGAPNKLFIITNFIRNLSIHNFCLKIFPVGTSDGERGGYEEKGMSLYNFLL